MWVNVSSGTGSPGWSQTKGCLTVIVVVVVCSSVCDWSVAND